MNRALGALLATGAVALLLCCRPTERAEESINQGPADETPSEQRLPLHSYLSGIGLRWLVVIKPPLLFTQKLVKTSQQSLLGLKSLVLPHLLENVQTNEIEEIWIGGYDHGQLYVFDGRRADWTIEQNFRGEMTSLGEAPSELAGLQVLTGASELESFALMRIDGRMVAVAKGDPTLIRYSEAQALGTGKRGRSALEGSLLGRLKTHFPSSPLRIFVRGPYENAQGAVASQFVAGAADLSFSAQEVTTHLIAVGVWPATTDTEDLLVAWMTRVLEAPEFRALELHHTVSRDNPRCHWDAEFDVGRGLTVCESSLSWKIEDLAKAFLRINRAEMDELLD